MVRPRIRYTLSKKISISNIDTEIVLESFDSEIEHCDIVVEMIYVILIFLAQYHWSTRVMLHKTWK